MVGTCCTVTHVLLAFDVSNGNPLHVLMHVNEMYSVRGVWHCFYRTDIRTRVKKKEVAHCSTIVLQRMPGLQDFSVRLDFYWSQSIASFSRSPPLKCPCTWQIFLEVRTDPNEIIHLVENLQNKNGRSVFSGELLTWPNTFGKSFIWLWHLARIYPYPHYMASYCS